MLNKATFSWDEVNLSFTGDTSGHWGFRILSVTMTTVMRLAACEVWTVSSRATENIFSSTLSIPWKAVIVENRESSCQLYVSAAKWRYCRGEVKLNCKKEI